MDKSLGMRGLPGRKRHIAVCACVALALFGVLSTAWATPAPGSSSLLARTARTLVANDEGQLHKVGESGADLIEEGSVTGTLPGRVRAGFNIGAVIEATFTLYPHGGGTLTGRGSGELHSSGRYASFGGTMRVTGGSGRYSHAHGTGGFYGTVNRKTYALVVQTRGTLRY